MSICLSVYASVCRFVCVSVYLSVGLSMCLSSVYVSICMCVCRSAYLSLCPSVCLSMCLSVYLSVTWLSQILKLEYIVTGDQIVFLSFKKNQMLKIFIWVNLLQPNLFFCQILNLCLPIRHAILDLWSLYRACTKLIKYAMNMRYEFTGNYNPSSSLCRLVYGFLPVTPTVCLSTSGLRSTFCLYPLRHLGE